MSNGNTDIVRPNVFRGYPNSNPESSFDVRKITLSGGKKNHHNPYPSLPSNSKCITLSNSIAPASLTHNGQINATSKSKILW